MISWGGAQGGTGGGICPPNLYVKKGPASSVYIKKTLKLLPVDWYDIYITMESK